MVVFPNKQKRCLIFFFHTVTGRHVQVLVINHSSYGKKKTMKEKEERIKTKLMTPSPK